jgi:hypothetical protein
MGGAQGKGHLGQIRCPPPSTSRRAARRARGSFLGSLQGLRDLGEHPSVLVPKLPRRRGGGTPRGSRPLVAGRAAALARPWPVVPDALMGGRETGGWGVVVEAPLPPGEQARSLPRSPASCERGRRARGSGRGSLPSKGAACGIPRSRLRLVPGRMISINQGRRRSVQRMARGLDNSRASYLQTKVLLRSVPCCLHASSSAEAFAVASVGELLPR